MSGKTLVREILRMTPDERRIVRDFLGAINDEEAEKIRSVYENNLQMDEGALEEPEVEESQNVTDEELEKIVTNELHKLGISAHLKGYEYIRSATIMLVKDMDLINSITKGIYANLAIKYEATPSRVERLIRHAIERAWKCDETLEERSKIFGYKINPNKGKPANSEFLAFLAEYIRLQIKVG